MRTRINGRSGGRRIRFRPRAVARRADILLAGLIQDVPGSFGGAGGLLTQRRVGGVGGVQDLGAAAWTAGAWPWWTSAAVCRPSPP
jgi:hypothetical protein